MEFVGICRTLDKIVVSDPSYAEGVWCRYERNDIGGKDWRVHGFIKEVADTFEYEGESIPTSGVEFMVGMCAPGEHLLLREDGSFRHSAQVKVNEFEIGMDTACVGLGVNGVADEIKAGRGEWQPDCCLKTLTDGMFGSVLEGVRDDNVRFLVISGYLDEDAGYSVEDVLEYLQAGLGFELDKGLALDGVIKEAKSRTENNVDVSNEKIDKELD